MNFPSPDPAPEKSAYKFLSGDDALKELVNEMNAESSKVSDDDFEPPTFETDTESNPNEDAKKFTGIEKPSESAQRAAEAVVKTFSDLFARALSAYAKEDYETFKFEPKEVGEVAGYFAPYLKPENTKIPDYVWGLIVAGFLMFDRVKLAGAMRKNNLEAERKEKQIKELNRKIEEQQGRIKVLELQEKEAKLKEKVKTLEKE